MIYVDICRYISNTYIAPYMQTICSLSLPGSYNDCQALYSWSITGTHEVCHLKKGVRVGNANFCCFWGPNEMKWSFIIAGENLAKSKEELTDNKLFLQKSCKTSHKISLLYLENFRIHLTVYTWFIANIIKMWILTRYTYWSCPYMSEYSYNYIIKCTKPKFPHLQNGVGNKITFP